MKLQEFGGLMKANELSDLVVEDLRPLKEAFGCKRLAEQQIASADSIAANIEKGFGLGSRKEYRQFLIIAAGSAQETRDRSGRLKHWLPPETKKTTITPRGNHRHPAHHHSNAPRKRLMHTPVRSPTLTLRPSAVSLFFGAVRRRSRRDRTTFTLTSCASAAPTLTLTFTFTLRPSAVSL